MIHDCRGKWRDICASTRFDLFCTIGGFFWMPCIYKQLLGSFGKHLASVLQVDESDRIIHMPE